jgi:hypothetical protein
MVYRDMYGSGLVTTEGRHLPRGMASASVRRGRQARLVANAPYEALHKGVANRASLRIATPAEFFRALSALFQ